MAWAPAAIGAGAALYSAFKGQPESPDYQQVSAQQAQQNKEAQEYQTRVNRPTVVTPFGTQRWTEGSYMAETQTPNPEYQQMQQQLEAIKSGQGVVLNRDDVIRKMERQLANTPQTITSSQERPTWEMNVELPEDLQKAYEAQMSLARGQSELAESLLPQTRAALGTPIDYSALPSAGSALSPYGLTSSLDFSGVGELGTGEEARNRAEQAIYERATSRLDPQFQEQENSLRSRLYNQGLREGDAAYDAEMRKFQESKTDAYQTAMNEAITAGGAEASRTFGMDLARRQQEVGEQQAAAEFMNKAAAQGLSQDQAISAYQNILRQNALTEEQQRRNQTLNEMSALTSGQQVSMPSFPSYTTAGAYQTSDLLGAAQAQYGANLQQYGTSQAQQNQLMQGLAGLYPYLYGSFTGS